MKRSELKKELAKMLEVESKILLAMAYQEGTEKEQIYVCSKLFEVAEYIMTIKKYLEATKDND